MPIINYPEVGILGLGKVVKRPVYDDEGRLFPVDIIYLSLRLITEWWIYVMRGSATRYPPRPESGVAYCRRNFTRAQARSVSWQPHILDVSWHSPIRFAYTSLNHAKDHDSRSQPGRRCGSAERRR